MKQGKHRVVQALPGYYLSVLPYTKKKALKAELNEVFREEHPSLPEELTLSKIRNLKRETLEHAKRLNLEFSTAALAIIYFEKLVLKGVVLKQNRKLAMSVCLVIAFKFNEPKRPGAATLKDLLVDIERVQSLTHKQVLQAEFPVFGHLLFHLDVDKDQILYHFQKLLKAVETTPTEYLGEQQALFHFPDDATAGGSPPNSPIFANAGRHYTKRKPKTLGLLRRTSKSKMIKRPKADRRTSSFTHG